MAETHNHRLTAADFDAADIERDAEARGAYIEQVVYASRPCNQRSYCRDECECQIAASINAATVTRLADFCCHDPGDCADAACGTA